MIVPSVLSPLNQNKDVKAMSVTGDKVGKTGLLAKLMLKHNHSFRFERTSNLNNMYTDAATSNERVLV